jgi:hypothetical protein
LNQYFPVRCAFCPIWFTLIDLPLVPQIRKQFNPVI